MERQEPLERPQRLRIAHVITRLVNGGADENVVLSCNHASRGGHDVILIHGAHTRPEILAKLDGRVRTLALSSLVRSIAPLSDAKALRDLVRAFRRLDPHVVHTHTSKAGILGRLAARVVKTPVIVHGVHIVPFANVGPLEALVYRAAERAVAATTHAFVDVSSGVRDLCVEAGIGAPERHHVVHSGFELPRFRNAVRPRDWRDLLRVQPNEPPPPVLLMLAAFEPRKRHLEFLEYFPNIVARFPDVRLILAGGGGHRTDIEARIEALDLNRNVILSGFHRHPEQLIALADICLLASMREGLPRVVVQSLAAGKPVLAADLPGLDEVLEHDVNGLITPPDDLAALTDSVIALLKDDARRARLSRGAAATNLDDWDAERMGEGVEAVYAHVISESEQRRLHALKAVAS
jgi:glycosyltransferase involved in cell wall biosynthesis